MLIRWDDASQYAVIDHLRSLLWVNMPQNGAVLFRYYSPRLLKAWQPSHVYDHRPKAQTLAHNKTEAKVVEAWQVSQGSRVRFVRDCWLLEEEASNNTIEVLDGYVPVDSLPVKPRDKVTTKAPEKTSGDKA